MFGIIFWLVVVGFFISRTPKNRQRINDYLQQHPELKAYIRPPLLYILIFVGVLLYAMGGFFLLIVGCIFFIVSVTTPEGKKVLEEWREFLTNSATLFMKKSVPKTASQTFVSSQTTSSSFTPSSSMNLILVKRVFYRIIACIIVLFVFSKGLPWYTVSPGEIALITRLGKLQENYATEGLNFKIPLIDKVIRINVQTQKVEATANAASKDLQNISATIAVNGNVQAASAKELYRNLGDASLVAEKIINPSIQESVKAATAKYTAEELITKRTAVSQDIRLLLVEKLEKRGIQVSDVNIVNFQFSADFDAAIEKKVKAEQEALAEKNKLESVKFQAQQKIEQAKAEAESIRIQAEAIKSQGGLEYVNLKWIEKWDGKLPQTSLGEGNGVLLNLK